MVSILIVLIGLIVATPARPATGIDLTLVGTGDTYVIKSHLFMLLSLGNGIEVGPILFIDRPEKFFVDGIAGLGIRFGKSYFLEIDGGYYYGHGKNQNGEFHPRGYAGALIPGIVFRGFRLTFPIVAKRVEKGDAQKWDVEFIPYIGFEF